MLIVLNIVFGALLICYCHFIDGPVTKALKEELREQGVKF